MSYVEIKWSNIILESMRSIEFKNSNHLSLHPVIREDRVGLLHTQINAALPNSSFFCEYIYDEGQPHVYTKNTNAGIYLQVFLMSVVQPMTLHLIAPGPQIST